MHVYAAEAPAPEPPTVPPREGTWEVPAGEFMAYVEQYQQDNNVDLVLDRVGKGGCSWELLSMGMETALHLADRMDAMGQDEQLSTAAEILAKLDGMTATGDDVGCAAKGDASGGGAGGGGAGSGGAAAGNGAAAGSGAADSGTAPNNPRAVGGSGDGRFITTFAFTCHRGSKEKASRQSEDH